jgi:DNA primase
MSNTRIADRDIVLVRDHNPLYTIVLESHVDLVDAEGGTAKGLCPFHAETKPSFQVTPRHGMWYCFGCGEAGDVITFVMKKHNLTFAEAVERLAKRANISLSYEPTPYLANEAVAETLPGGHLKLTFGCVTETVVIEVPPALTQLFVSALNDATRA